MKVLQAGRLHHDQSGTAFAIFLLIELVEGVASIRRGVMENFNDRPASRSVPMLVWAVIIGGVLLLMGWIFGFPWGGTVR